MSKVWRLGDGSLAQGCHRWSSKINSSRTFDSMNSARDLAALPKCELHIHLEGVRLHCYAALCLIRWHRLYTRRASFSARQCAEKGRVHERFSGFHCFRGELLFAVDGQHLRAVAPPCPNLSDVPFL
jgi:hypothetical protein